MTTLKRVAAAILDAETSWTPKSAVPRERAMALAALEAMPKPLLQQLHDIEINGSIDWIFDRAWHVTIGSPVKAEAAVQSYEEAEAWLKEKAREIYGEEID